MPSHVVYIETMGCQMNKLDSELVAGRLVAQGYRLTDDPDEAGVIIFNTCSVRGHAESKVISKIGQLRRRGPSKDFVLAVIGCMAQRLGAELLRRHPQIDIVCGPGRLHQLPDLIEQAQHGCRTVLLNDPAEMPHLEELDYVRRRDHVPQPFSAYVRVMRGCNNFCSYCIVPYVRGPEWSRPPDHVFDECRRLAAAGVVEITLLGQTVNSYRYQHHGRRLGLADLLERIHEIPGLARIRFVTSYPRNFDLRILHAMACLPKVCPYLHLPAQSGSDRILRAMKRRYTAAEYLDLVDHARAVVPDLALAGDFIVGFPGETDDDFAATQDLLRRVRYKNCFVFRYSPRPGTRADERLPDDVPLSVKRRRNTELLELQARISLADNQHFVGRTVEVLVEGPSKNPHLDETPSARPPRDRAGADRPNRCAACVSPGDATQPQLVGRTPGDHIVVFRGPSCLIGRITTVRVTKVSALTLFAELPPEHSADSSPAAPLGPQG